MATTDFIKQYEIITAAEVVSAFNEKENLANKKTTLTNSTTDYPSTSLLTTELNKKLNLSGGTITGVVNVPTPALPS